MPISCTFLFVALSALPAAAQAPAQASQSPTTAEWLAKGSSWWGKSYQVKPTKTAPQSISLIILDRNGNDFRADMLWNGRHLRYVAGKVDGDRIEWSAAPGERNQGHFNAGTIKGKRIDIKYFKTKDTPVEDGTLILEFQPVNAIRLSGDGRERLQNAALKIGGAALAHAAAVQAANQGDNDAFTVAFVVVALSARNVAIESALRDLFPRLSGRQSGDVRLLVTRAIEDGLSRTNRDEQAAKQRLINDLRQIDPEFADVAQAADFIYAIYQACRGR